MLEDDPKLASLVRKGLEAHGFTVDFCAHGDEAFTLATTRSYDALVLDIMVPGRDGLSILRNLRERRISTPVVLITARSALNERLEGLNLGADDYLTKPFLAEELVAAVTGRLERVRMFRQQREHRNYKEEEKVLCSRLTSREWEVLRLVGSGCTSKDIAEQLGIRINTVEVHRANLMKKLDASNAAQLARWAFIAEQITISDI